MTTPTVEIRLTLAESTARKLHEIAQAQGVPEEVLVEQALALLFGPDDAPPLDDYWFSVATLREDWDAMPDDWIADEAGDAVPSR
jgi:hypothetical protein